MSEKACIILLSASSFFLNLICQHDVFFPTFYRSWRKKTLIMLYSAFIDYLKFIF